MQRLKKQPDIQKGVMMNIENLQLSEEPGASPDVHLSSRFKIPDGWALVPVEPTQKMIASAFAGVVQGQCMEAQSNAIKHVTNQYKRMIKAAQKYSSQYKPDSAPEVQTLIKQEPDDELLQRMSALINNVISDGKIGQLGALVVYKLIANYAPTHNQD